jgi:hypothetical protein
MANAALASAVNRPDLRVIGNEPPFLEDVRAKRDDTQTEEGEKPSKQASLSFTHVTGPAMLRFDIRRHEGKPARDLDLGGGNQIAFGDFPQKAQPPIFQNAFAHVASAAGHHQNAGIAQNLVEEQLGAVVKVRMVERQRNEAV